MFNAKPPREAEKSVQKNIIVRLRRLGIRLWRRNVGAMQDGDRFIRFASPGQADLWGILPPALGCRHVEIEVKRPGNKPTPKQLEWLIHMSALGAVAWWSDSVNDCERVAEAILRGGRIVWDNEGPEYHVEMP